MKNTDYSQEILTNSCQALKRNFNANLPMWSTVNGKTSQHNLYALCQWSLTLVLEYPTMHLFFVLLTPDQTNQQFNFPYVKAKSCETT